MSARPRRPCSAGLSGRSSGSGSSAGIPLAGAETAGVENARADLFEGARWYLTPTERSSGVLYDRLQRAIADLGARPQAIDAETHDRLMATVSHVPHVIANVLVREAAAAEAEESERLPEVGPSFRDTTRVAGANPAIWGDIFATNREAVAREVEAVSERLREAAAADPLRGPRTGSPTWHQRGPRGSPTPVRGRAGRAASCASSGSGSRTGRAPWPRSRWRSVAPGVNIEDMALYPAPDMRTGAVTLWVAGDDGGGAGGRDRARPRLLGLGLR